MDFDVILVGGSYAGISAGLQLARARRRVLVVDAGMRRNRFAAASHGFLGQDGRPPGAIAEEARAQLLAYPNVRWLQDLAVAAQQDGGGFRVILQSGAAARAARLVLACGVTDEMPPLEGVAARWGRSIFHCPYCHGYELDGGAIGVLAAGPVSLHHAMMLPDWGRVTLFTNGTFEPDAAQAAALAARGVAVERARVLRISGTATVELEDGRRPAFRGLFTACRTHLGSSLAGQLGCALEEGPTGPYIRTDEFKQTSVPGVFACGDAARGAGNVAMAVGDGALAGAAAHRTLIFG